MEEKWKDIEGYEGYYQVSNMGRVRSWNNRWGKLDEPNVMALPSDKRGYEHVTLQRNKEKETILIHRLVANAFVPNPENKPQVNHKDLNKSNNIATNLEWVTCSENLRHGYANGAEHKSKGEGHGRAKFKEDDILRIRSLYKTGDYSQAEIANEYDVSPSCIYKIVNKKRWAHV